MKKAGKMHSTFVIVARADRCHQSAYKVYRTPSQIKLSLMGLRSLISVSVRHIADMHNILGLYRRVLANFTGGLVKKKAAIDLIAVVLFFEIPIICLYF